MKQKFTKWFNRHKFQHFSADEFTSYFELTRRGVTNSYPPEHMWGNIIHTLRVVDELRDHFGRAVVILSSYRSPAYNAAINGAASNSFHKQFIALDIAVAGKSPKEVYDYLLSRRRDGRFTGGLGLYPTFVHIDTRGYNANW